MAPVSSTGGCSSSWPRLTLFGMSTPHPRGGNPQTMRSSHLLQSFGDQRTHQRTICPIRPIGPHFHILHIWGFSRPRRSRSVSVTPLRYRTFDRGGSQLQADIRMIRYFADGVLISIRRHRLAVHQRQAAEVNPRSAL